MKIGAALGLILAMFGSACDQLPESVAGSRSPTFRYRLTAIVDTPQGIRTGSSVIQIRWSTGGRALGPMQGGSITQQGDAVTVDLPNGQKLFVLLTARWQNYDWPGWSLQTVYGAHAQDPAGVSHDVRSLPRLKADSSGKMVNNWPYFVTFDDPRVMMSIREVDPDDLAATFGKGYSMKGLTVQLTDEPITRDIGKSLPWIATLEGGGLDKSRRHVMLEDATIAELVLKQSFTREQ